jgi:hypothetical protein
MKFHFMPLLDEMQKCERKVLLIRDTTLIIGFFMGYQESQLPAKSEILVHFADVPLI